VHRRRLSLSMVATVAEEGSTAEAVFVLVEATLLMGVDTTTAAITAVAMVGTAIIGATLATGTDGDLVLALAGDPTGLLTGMLTVMVPGGALLTTITHAPILIILRPAAHMLIHIPTTATAVVPHQILEGTVTTTLRLNYRAFPHRRTLLGLPL
jgi:hypothetical protein